MTKTASGLPPAVLKVATGASPTDEEAWEEHGRRIWLAVNRSAWDLGEWWNAGEAYGDRVERARRIGWEHGTCRDAGYVSAAFDVSRRRDTLSWSHHVEVAALSEADQEFWLDEAERLGYSQKVLREGIKLARFPAMPRELPEGTFDVLLADPPWQYDFAETTNRQIENQYPTMSVDAIALLEPPAAPDAVLFCWATAPKLREALVVLGAWGFEYKTNLVWVKDRIGMGYWARGRHEHLLVATCGTPGVPEPSVRPDSVIEAPRSEHSRKPPQVHDLIQAALPGRSYLELFAREPREGWTSWGNEV